MMRPPAGVRLVIDAVSIMREVKPKKVAGEKMGTKVDDYWEPGKALLQDPGKVIINWKELYCENRVADQRYSAKLGSFKQCINIISYISLQFLESLFKFDRDNIPESVITKIQPYIDNDDFMPQAIAKVSKACTSICQWVRAMHK